MERKKKKKEEERNTCLYWFTSYLKVDSCCPLAAPDGGVVDVQGEVVQGARY